MAEYVIYYDNPFIFLQFSSGGEIVDRVNWISEFEKNRELFNLVANSLVIMDKY